MIYLFFQKIPWQRQAEFILRIKKSFKHLIKLRIKDWKLRMKITDILKIIN
jgi:hypothetical protein